MEGDPLLEVRDLRVYFETRDGTVKAVDGVSFSIEPGETLGLVGESGCGKSVTAMSIMRLVPHPPARTVSGSILFQGRDLLKLSEAGMRRVRGKQIAMIFQDPMTCLNPVLTIGRQIMEALQRHLGMTKRQARARAIELLELVGIPTAAKRIDDYPHQFSGGMRQRVMIAMALSCSPQLLIADEPTTALDVTIQAQILELIAKLRREFNTAVMLITHDMGVVAGVSDRIVVMYAGRPMETADAEVLFSDPRHPYTMGLLHSIPRLDEERKERLVPIQGLPPDLISLPAICPFAPRCTFAVDQCRAGVPELRLVELNHYVACIREITKERYAHAAVATSS
ncbi:MAG: ABC transporter ATP-binding protein [Chloroflexi bacterium]|nr:ABC transporter ATP-binding protein [Chloroflexota bacterium]